jgi:hypothetical protein
MAPTSGLGHQGEIGAVLRGLTFHLIGGTEKYMKLCKVAFLAFFFGVATAAQGADDGKDIKGQFTLLSAELGDWLLKPNMEKPKEFGPPHPTGLPKKDEPILPFFGFTLTTPLDHNPR